MNDKRRKLLFGIMVATVLLQWHKPITNLVILPVHAQSRVRTTQDVIGIWNVSFKEKTGLPIISYELLIDGSEINLDPSASEKTIVAWTLSNDQRKI